MALKNQPTSKLPWARQGAIKCLVLVQGPSPHASHMDQPEPQALDLGSLLEIVLLSVRRTAVFMGLGLNAASDPTFKAYQLAKITGAEFVPSDAPDATIAHYKEEFSLWVLNCGLRELTESFEVFLSGVYKACLLMRLANRSTTSEEATKRHKKFSHLGLNQQLEELQREFGVSTPRAEAMVSLSAVRNTITHRRGVVGPKDGATGLTISWWGCELYVETESGKIIQIPSPLGPENEPIVLEAASTLKMAYRERKAVFQHGDVVKFRSKDVAEICQMVLVAGQEVINSLTAHLLAKGAQETGSPRATQLQAHSPPVPVGAWCSVAGCSDDCFFSVCTTARLISSSVNSSSWSSTMPRARSACSGVIGCWSSRSTTTTPWKPARRRTLAREGGAGAETEVGPGALLLMGDAPWGVEKVSRTGGEGRDVMASRRAGPGRQPQG